MVLATVEAQKKVLETMSRGLIRVGVVGNVDVGKSSLVGTLKTGTLDDGRGLCRSKIMKHKHEKDTGRTSAISEHHIGFDENGTLLVPSSSSSSSPLSQTQIAVQSARVVSLMDLAGHEKYFKTTVAGMSMGMADYALVLVNGAQSPTHMTMHHLRLCIACGIPPILVITKVDSCPSQVLQHTKKKVAEIIRSPEFGKRQFAVKNGRDVETVQDKLHSLVPILSVSCVTGEGLDLLKQLLFSSPKRRHHENKIKRSFEFLIEDVFNIKGIGSVISGLVNAGEYRKGDPLFIGPMRDGTYTKAVVRSIHVAQTDVDHTYAGHSACFALSSLTKTQRSSLGKGMVALTKLPSDDLPTAVVRTFQADMVMLKGEPVTVTKGQYTASAHILHLKQTVKVVCIEGGTGIFGQVRGDSSLILRPGDTARVTFKFVNKPAYVRKGMRIILRDGHVRAIGVIVKTDNKR